MYYTWISDVLYIGTTVLGLCVGDWWLSSGNIYKHCSLIYISAFSNNVYYHTHTHTHTHKHSCTHQHENKLHRYLQLYTICLILVIHHNWTLMYGVCVCVCVCARVPVWAFAQIRFSILILSKTWKLTNTDVLSASATCHIVITTSTTTSVIIRKICWTYQADTKIFWL